MKKRQPPPKFEELRHVQLVLDLPQFQIPPGARILVLGGILKGKTGRLRPVYLSPHRVSFPGGICKSIDRYLLVEIQ
jgi:hypothetical protein